MIKAILFGSIGTIIETSEIQRASFNQAFLEKGLDWYWSKETYKKLIKKSGGSKRIKDFAKKNQVNINSNLLREKKTEIFNKKLKTEKIPPREGVIEIIEYAKSHNVKIGLASTTSTDNINALFTTVSNVIYKNDFDFIGSRTVVDKPKPEPDIYFKAIRSLGINSKECVAIEDSYESALSAYKTNIKCIAFPGAYHMDDDFKICQKKLNKLDISIFDII